MLNPSLITHVGMLAHYLPNGPLFEAKNINDSNFRQLLKGLSGELFNAQGYLVSLNNEYFPDETVLFLSEWEKALGIPDDCFSGLGTNDTRRRDILVKLASLGVQTADDFERLGDIFGIDITVSKGIEVGSFPMSFPLIFFPTPTNARYTIIINFPLPLSGSFFIYNFPIIFGTSEEGILKCLFEKLKPSNCEVIFRSS